MNFTLKVYRHNESPTRTTWYSGGYFECDWTYIISNMAFTTKNPGGNSECQFYINGVDIEVFNIYASYIHYWVDIGDGLGNIVWRGRISSLTYERGQATVICEGWWANMFDAFYDDGSFSGDPGAEHSILNATTTGLLNATYDWYAQSFQLSEDLAIRDIAIRLVNVGALPGEYIWVQLKEDDGSGSPVNTHALATQYIQCETIAAEETIFTGIATNYRLNADTDYWIQIGRNSSVTADKVGWRYDNTSGYTDGVMKYWNGASWAAFSGDAIFYVWTHPRFYYYSVDFENGDFEETAGSGTFDDWTDNVGTGAIAIETSLVYEGVNSAKLTAGSGTDTYIYQECPAVEGSDYTLSFYTRGDGTYAGRYRIYDVTNSADITATTSTGVTGTTYTLVEADFSAPATCERFRIYFYCPSTNGGIAYFDYASIDGDYSYSSDVIVDAVSQSELLINETSQIITEGPAVNPILFANNEKPGEVVSKMLTFGSGDAVPEAMYFGIEELGSPVYRPFSGGTTWDITEKCLAVGEQGFAVSADLDRMKTKVATLYSGAVGERNVTTWVTNPAMLEQFGYDREGLFSVAGASEAIADIVATVIADAYSSQRPKFSLLLEGYVGSSSVGEWPVYMIRAGDRVNLNSLMPVSTAESSYGADVSELNVTETSYDAVSGRLSLSVFTDTGTLIDVILALAGLSGGSMI